jgi:hypothetical protein
LVTRLLPALLLVLAALPVAAKPPRRVVREERQVTVDGRTETWRLEWQEPPKPFCVSAAEGMTAPCEGFAYGEEGRLDLVRIVGKREVDRLALTPLFRYSLEGATDGPTLARLRRWPVEESDRDTFDVDTKALAEALPKRTPVPVLVLEDLDGDGRAREWVLQTDALDSSMFPAIAIGLDAAGRLAPLATAEHPQRPLVLYRPELWRDLGKGQVIALPCGDHGSASELSVRFSRDGKGLHAKRVIRVCDDPGPASEDNL